MFVLHIKKIYRNPVIMCMSIAFIIGLVYYLFIAEDQYGTVQAAISVMIKSQPYIFLFMMFLSYEIFYSFQRSGYGELMGSRYIYLKCQKYDFIILMTYGCLVFGLVFCYMTNFYYNWGLRETEFYFYLIRLSIIFVLLPIVLAICIGWVLSSVPNRITGIALLLVCFYCFDRAFLQSIVGLDKQSPFLFKIGTLFSIIESQMPGAVTDEYYLMSAENVHLYSVCFWLLGVLALVCLLARIKVWFVVSAVASLGCLILFFQPSGASYALPVTNGFDRWLGEQYYYTEERQQYEQEQFIDKNRDDFLVEHYEMNFEVKDILKSKVVVRPNDGSLDSYQFTLYHSYQLQSVKDQNGKNLKYSQQGDYVEVFNPENITEIQFEYQGANQYFYSTSQGILLPANYAYYPMPGWNRTFINDFYNTCFTQEALKNIADFSITISVPERLKVYSNFLETDVLAAKGYKQISFQGKSNGLTIVGSPYLRDKMVDGVRVVYTYISEFREESYNPEHHPENFQSCFQSLQLSDQPMTFFETPEENYGNCFFATDHIVDQIFKTEEDYETYCKQGNVYNIPDEEDEEMKNKVMEMLD